METPFLPVSARVTAQSLIRRHVWQEIFFYVPLCISKSPCVAQSCIGVKLLQWLQDRGSTWCQLRVSSPRGAVGPFPLISFCLIPTSSDKEEMIVRRGISLSILVVLSLVQTLQAAGLGHTHRSSQTLNFKHTRWSANNLETERTAPEAEGSSERWIYAAPIC